MHLIAYTVFVFNTFIPKGFMVHHCGQQKQRKSGIHSCIDEYVFSTILSVTSLFYSSACIWPQIYFDVSIKKRDEVYRFLC